MLVIPVIDLMNGLVVRGVAGRRHEYRPIQSDFTQDALPGTVALALASRFGFDTVYVADLDAIMHVRPDCDAWRKIAAAGLALWLDAGVGTGDRARQMLRALRSDAIRSRLIIGLESLQSEQDLAAIIEACEDQPPIFSLDLKAGRPLTSAGAWRGMQSLDIVLLAVARGISDLIVLDLADVGVGHGTRTLDLCRQIHDAAPGARLIAGGGVRGIDDLRALADAGCDAALVATALHDGRLTKDDLRQVETCTANRPHRCRPHRRP